MSTGRSIHAVPSITPSLREAIEEGPRLRVRTPFQSRSIDADLAERVRAYFKEHPAVSWIEAVEAVAGRAS